MNPKNVETLIAMWEGGEIMDSRELIRALIDERNKAGALRDKLANDPHFVNAVRHGCAVIAADVAVKYFKAKK